MHPKIFYSCTALLLGVTLASSSSPTWARHGGGDQPSGPSPSSDDDIIHPVPGSPPPPIVIETERGPIVHPRSGLEGIAILTPNQKIIDTPRPTLSWQAVEGVAIYQVELQGPNLYCSELSSATELPYLENCPSLRLGENYTLTVTAELESGEVLVNNVGFTYWLANEEQSSIANLENSAVD